MVDLARSRSIIRLLDLNSRQQKQALQLAGLFLGSATLASCQGELLLAMGLGSGAMFAIYQLSLDQNWRRYGQPVRQLLEGTNGKLAIAIAGGVSTTVAVYAMKMLWQELEQKWLITMIGLEGLGILGILGLVGWQIWHQHRDRGATGWRNQVELLTDHNPVKQLLAVNRLQESLRGHPLPEPEVRELQAYIQLLLNQSPDPLVSQGLLQLLSRLRPIPTLQPLQLNTTIPKLTPKLLIPEQESAS